MFKCCLAIPAPLTIVVLGWLLWAMVAAPACPLRTEGGE
jgi:hypothetical protein